jgi:hypothetical protein
MKSLASAIALTFALATMTAPAAYAQEPAAAFRTAEPQAFTTDELQRYGLSAEDAAQVADLQAQGYEVQVMTPEEASQVTGGQFSSTQWLVIGIIVVLVVVAVAA